MSLLDGIKRILSPRDEDYSELNEQRLTPFQREVYDTVDAIAVQYCKEFEQGDKRALEKACTRIREKTAGYQSQLTHLPPKLEILYKETLREEEFSKFDCEIVSLFTSNFGPASRRASIDICVEYLNNKTLTFSEGDGWETSKEIEYFHKNFKINPPSPLLEKVCEGLIKEATYLDMFSRFLSYFQRYQKMAEVVPTPLEKNNKFLLTFLEIFPEEFTGLDEDKIVIKYSKGQKFKTRVSLSVEDLLSKGSYNSASLLSSKYGVLIPQERIDEKACELLEKVGEGETTRQSKQNIRDYIEFSKGLKVSPKVNDSFALRLLQEIWPGSFDSYICVLEDYRLEFSGSEEFNNHVKDAYSTLLGRLNYHEVKQLASALELPVPKEAVFKRAIDLAQHPPQRSKDEIELLKSQFRFYLDGKDWHDYVKKDLKRMVLNGQYKAMRSTAATFDLKLPWEAAIERGNELLRERKFSEIKNLAQCFKGLEEKLGFSGEAGRLSIVDVSEIEGRLTIAKQSQDP